MAGPAVTVASPHSCGLSSARMITGRGDARLLVEDPEQARARALPYPPGIGMASMMATTAIPTAQASPQPLLRTRAIRRCRIGRAPQRRRLPSCWPSDLACIKLAR